MKHICHTHVHTQTHRWWSGEMALLFWCEFPENPTHPVPHNDCWEHGSVVGSFSQWSEKTPSLGSKSPEERTLVSETWGCQAEKATWSYLVAADSKRLPRQAALCLGTGERERPFSTRPGFVNNIFFFKVLMVNSKLGTKWFQVK